MAAGANVRAEVDPCVGSPPAVCETDWYTSSGMGRPTAPERAPCLPGETSLYRKLDQRPARSIYSSCKPLIQVYDIPNDDFGVLGNLRSAMELCRLSQSDNTIITLPMAAGAMVFPKAAGAHMAHGVWIRYAYTALQVTAPVLNVTTAGCFATVGLAPVNRNITFQLQQGCLEAEIYLPFGAAQQASAIFAPICATPVGGVANVTITGFAAVAGTVSVQFVGAYSQNMENIVAAVTNAKPK